MVIEKEGKMDVVEAANNRILNIFESKIPKTLSISGGKDSIVLAEIILKLLKEKRINPKALEVDFIDEEAMFDDVIEIVKKLRKRFMFLGVKFNWFCVQVKHYNCFDNLSEDETYICWDEKAEGRWIRDMPSFALKTDPLLLDREENYQSFLSRKNAGKISMIGLRMAESVQRRQAVSKMFRKTPPGNINTDRGNFYPIYDWKDSDVWLYIKQNNLDFPETYIRLYETGTSRTRLRISQFFSVDTAKVLVKLNEYDPGLMERVERRHPNAYLASLYWDSEMFRRSSSKRKKLESDKEKDYKEKVFQIYRNPKEYITSKTKQQIWRYSRNYFIQLFKEMKKRDFELWYNMLIGGDPKRRTLRGLMTKILSRRNAKPVNRSKKGVSKNEFTKTSI